MAVAFVQWLGQQVFNLTLGFSEDLEDDDEEEYVELQCGKTLFSAVPARMRTELWLSQLHHDAPSVQAVRRYYSFVNQTPPRSVAAEIEKDLHRTFPGHPRLSSDAGQHALRRLLCAYASCDPAIGYTQGMNFVAALVVLTIPSEPEAFGIFWLLMQRRGLRELYTPDMSMLQVRLWQLGALLPPDLGAHMDAAGALPVLYASSWLLTCFAADFPRSFAARVLDLVVAGAYAAPVMRVALGILHAAAPALKKTTDLERMVRFLRRDVPRAAHETLHELLSRAMERPWTPRQLAVLERINDTETVAQAVQRTSRGPSGAGGEDDWGEWKASGEEGEEQGIGKREEEPGMDVREHPRTEISLHRDPLSYIGSPLHSPPGPSGASTPTARALRSPSPAPAPVSRGQGPDLLAPRVDSLVLCLPSQPSTLAAASPADVEEEDTLRDEDEDSRHFRDVFARLSALPPTPLRPSVAPPSVGGGEARIDPVADPVLDPQLSLALSHYRPSQRGPGGVDLGLESQASFLDSQEARPAPEPSDRPGRPFPLALAGSVASPGAHLPGVPSPFAAPSDRAAGGSAADLPWHGWHRRLSGGALGGGEEDGGDAALESSEFGSFHVGSPVCRDADGGDGGTGRDKRAPTSPAPNEAWAFAATPELEAEALDCLEAGSGSMHLPARSDSSMRALQQVQALVPFPVLAVASRSRNNPVPLPPVNLSAPAPLQPTTSSLRQSSVETARLLQLSHADQFLIGLRRGSSGRERTGEGMAREKGLNTPNKARALAPCEMKPPCSYERKTHRPLFGRLSYCKSDVLFKCTLLAANVMCVAFLAWDCLPELALVLLFNRDETFDRPSEASHFWEDDSRILGGRDGLGHGTWLAVNRGGRVACITNVREMTLRPATPGLLLSRGELPVRFLLTNRSVEEYLQAVDLDLYPGFNLIVADTRKKECASLSNRNSVGYAPLTAGFHAVSNAYVDHDFAKLRRGTERLEELRDQGAFEGGAVPWEELFALLDEETVLERNEEKLPRSFAPPSAEMACSAIFVRPLRWGREQFGTRAQTVLVAWQDGRVELRERSRESDGSWSAVTHAFCAAEDEGLMEEAAMAAE